MTLKRFFAALSAVLIFAAISPRVAHAETDELTETEKELETSAAKNSDFNAALQEKYKLTDEQMAQMKDAGLNAPHMAMTAQLAASSGKPLDEVLKMRTEQKMGWGKIAKELGVHPGEIGKSVSSLRKEARMERQETRRAERADRKAEREQRRQERKEQHSERKAARANKG